MKKFYSYPFYRWALTMLFCWPSFLLAQDDAPMAPVSRTYALTNATIIQAPGRKIDAATIVIKNGLIQSVGKGISIPPEAIIIKADSLFIYAGFIDGLSHTGVSKPKDDASKERPKDPGNPTPERAGITPQYDVRPFLNPADKSVEEMRGIGFTAAHVVPYGGMLPGNGSVILLGGSSADAMIVSNKNSFYSELTPAERAYPATVMGVMAKYRDLYRQATLTKNYQSLYASNRAGLERPASDRILEAFYPVIDKRQPVFFKAEKVLELQRVLILQKELGFTLTLINVKEGWDMIPKVKASNAQVFLSLELPEEKKDEKKADEKKPDEKKSDSVKQVKPKSIAELEKEVLEKRRTDFVNKYVAQASTYQKAGVKFGFSALTVKSKDISANLRRMITAGLSEDAALASLTTIPAEFFGLSDRLGTLDNGKIANLVISDKPYFNEKAKVRYVFVEGVLYKQELSEAKKADANAKVEIEGTWSVTIETPEKKAQNTLTIKKDGTMYSGTISGGQLPNLPENLNSVVLEGNVLKITYSVSIDGKNMDMKMEVIIDGSSFKGNISVPATSESFPVTGKKEPKL